MFDRLKPKSEFSGNVLTLMTGATIAQAIPIAISPILTRLYTPEDFGSFALYISIVSILSSVATGQYELAIMLPDKEEDSLHILFLSIISSLVVSTVLFCLVLLLEGRIVEILNDRSVSAWLYLVPFSVLMFGLFNSFRYWFNRKKSYRLLAGASVAKSFVNSGGNLIFGFMKIADFGLIVSSFLAQVASLVIMIYKFDFRKLRDIKRDRVITMLRKYKKFPKITLPHAIFNSLSQHLPILIISRFFTSSDTGFYSFGNKIVMLPISLISSSYYQVFFQTFKERDNRLNFYTRKFRQINTIFLPLFALLWFFLPDIFAFVFSDRWRVAGEYSQILLPLVYLQFISNLFTSTTYIYYQKQEENFILEVVKTAAIYLSLSVGFFFDSIKIGLTLLMLANSVIILYKLFRSYSFVKDEYERSV